jgi:hypothetical protein
MGQKRTSKPRADKSAWTISGHLVIRHIDKAAQFVPTSLTRNGG